MKNFIETYLKVSTIPAKKILSQSNSIVFSEMDTARGMYLIELGQVKILKKMPYTGSEIVLATLGPNDNFGELSLILGRPRAAGAVTVTNCTLWELDENTFKEAITKSPEFSLLIMRGLANKLSKMNEKHKEMLSHLSEFTERLEDFSTFLHSFVP